MTGSVLHHPNGAFTNAICLAHGAGSNHTAPLLVALCTQFAEAGWLAMRFDLAFRQQRPNGSPFPAIAAKDRESVRHAADHLRGLGAQRVVIGGHSYGGRQASMLAAEDASVADALLALSYPLHPPDKPDQLRTAHFPSLRMPSLFVHGTKDPFATVEELQQAQTLIPGETRLIQVPRAAHSLARPPFPEILACLQSFFSSAQTSS